MHSAITLPVNSTQLHGNTSSDPDGVIVTYAWTQISGPAQSAIGGGSDAVATVSNLTTGIYTFELKVTDDDGATSTKTMKVTVECQVDPKLMKIYPNPTAGVLNLQYVENTNGKFRITIYDATRRLMKDEVMDKNQVSVTKVMDVSQFESGVYLFILFGRDESKVVMQFVKM